MINHPEVEIFRQNPIPVGLELKPASNPPQLFTGREAVVLEATNKHGASLALKWYVSLNGKSEDELKAYADEVNGDEELFYQVGLTEEQVPNSHFTVLKDCFGKPQLYSIQRWLPGRILKETPLLDIIRDHYLRTSLANLYQKSAEVYTQTKRFPDLSGGDRIRFLGHETSDPLKIINPFRTPNIMVLDHTAILLDARTHHPKSAIVEEGIKFHRLMTIWASYILRI